MAAKGKSSSKGASKGRKGLPSPTKAKEIMRHGSVHGQALSKKQKGLFGMIAGGQTPTRSPISSRLRQSRRRK